MYYELFLDFNYNEAAVEDKIRLDHFIDTHKANAMGVIRSKLLLKVVFSSSRKIESGNLEKELGSIPIVSFRELEPEDQATAVFNSYKEK